MKTTKSKSKMGSSFLKIKLKDILIFAGIIALILILVFQSQPEPIFNVSPVNKIETRIEGKETIITTIERRIGDESKIISEIRKEVGLLRSELAGFKSKRDTLLIVQIQDTLIGALTSENTHLRTVVEGQDSVIVAQRYIINSKDTIIAIFQNDIDRVKKQRNISLLINAIQAGIIILKK